MLLSFKSVMSLYLNIREINKYFTLRNLVASEQCVCVYVINIVACVCVWNILD